PSATLARAVTWSVVWIRDSDSRQSRAFSLPSCLFPMDSLPLCGGGSGWGAAVPSTLAPVIEPSGPESPRRPQALGGGIAPATLVAAVLVAALAGGAVA